MAELLEVRGLKTYVHTSMGVVKAVDGVSFDVKQGETVALVGESGCGKTMTALSVIRLIPRPQAETTGGEIRFEGKNLLDLDDEEMRRIRGAEIAMIFQEPMTSLNPVLTIEGQLTETLEAHGAVSRREARERALDVTIQAQLLELMRGLSREFGVALVIITHNLGVVARYADRVNVMYAGKIIESGAAADIYRDPRHPYTIGLLHSVPR